VCCGGRGREELEANVEQRFARDVKVIRNIRGYTMYIVTETAQKKDVETVHQRILLPWQLGLQVVYAL
jgi:hypothetical protein